MTFLALDVQKNYMLLQQSSLQFDRMCVSNQKQYIETKMAAVQQAGQINANKTGETYDLTTDSNYQALYLAEQVYATQEANLETQLKTLAANIDGFQKMIKDGIEKECKINYLG